MRRVGVGFVGAGRISDLHAIEYLRNDASRIPVASPSEALPGAVVSARSSDSRAAYAFPHLGVQWHEVGVSFPHTAAGPCRRRTGLP